MPKIKLMMNVSVDTKEHAQIIYDKLRENISWFGRVNSEEDYWIAFHLCTHDENHREPCKILEEWRNGRVTYHNGEPVP